MRRFCPLACWALCSPLLTGEPTAEPLRLDLEWALVLAHTQGRDKKTQEEELELRRQALQVSREDFWPQLQGALNAGVQGRGSDQPTYTQGASGGVSQSLPTGGTVEATATTTANQQQGREPGYGTGAQLSFSQPLLRGAGYLRWREGLTSTEREYVYTLRAHQEFLQNLTLGIAQSFWNLLEQRFACDRNHEALVRARFLLEQTRAFQDLGRATAVDVFRAELSLAQAEQTVIDDEAGLAANLDGFKLELAVPIAQSVDLRTDPPAMPALTIDTARAIALAVECRLDWATAQDRVVDAQRGLALARNDLLPDLRLESSLGWTGDDDQPWSNTFRDDPNWSVNLKLEIPFERRRERLAYRTRLVALGRVQRDLEAIRQRIIRQVEAAVRNLRRAQASLAIQDRQRTQSGLRLEKSRLDFESGAISNRDYVEAQAEVRQAEVNRFSALIACRLAELQLRRDTGCLTLDSKGGWSTTWPSYITIAEAQGKP